MQIRESLLLTIAALCCFVPGWAAAQDVEPARFHHVHLNVTDPAASIQFYQRVFGAVPVKFRGAADAVFTERSFILFNQVANQPESRLNTGLWHIGWGGVDVLGEYEWWKRHGVNFHTTPQPLSGSDNYYMYISGPNSELIEINTMGHHRFAHVHFFADDLNETVDWYATHLGLRPRRPRVPKPDGDMSTLGSIWANFIRCDNVSMIYFGKPDIAPPPRWWPDPPLKVLEPTRGRPIDHIAFSYPNIEPVYDRMKAAGTRIVEPIATREQYRMKSFFVLAPDGVLVEIVEAKSIPEGLWEDES